MKKFVLMILCVALLMEVSCGKPKKSMKIVLGPSFTVTANNVQPDCESVSLTGEFSAKFYAVVDKETLSSRTSAASFEVAEANLIAQMTRAALRSGAGFPLTTSLTLKAVEGDRFCVFANNVIEHDTFNNDRLSTPVSCMEVPSEPGKQLIRLSMTKGTCSLRTLIAVSFQESDTSPPPTKTPRQVQAIFGPSIEVKASNIDPDCEDLGLFDSDALFSTNFFANLNNEKVLIAAMQRTSFSLRRPSTTLTTSVRVNGREGQQLCVNSFKTVEHDKIRNDVLSESTQCTSLDLAKPSHTFRLTMNKGACQLSASIPVRFVEYKPPPPSRERSVGDAGTLDGGPDRGSPPEPVTCPDGGTPPCKKYAYLPYQRDCAGNDLSVLTNVDLQTCTRKCSADSSCKGLSYSVSENRCVTKTRGCAYPGATNNGYLFYQRYLEYPADCAGNDLPGLASQVSSLNACLAACARAGTKGSRTVRFEKILVGAININPDCEKASLNGEFSTVLSVTVDGGPKKELARVKKVSLKTKESVPVNTSVTVSAATGQEICVLSSDTIEHDTLRDDDLSEDKKCVRLADATTGHRFDLTMRKGSCTLVAQVTAVIRPGPPQTCKGVSFSPRAGRCVPKSATCAFPGNAPGSYKFYSPE